MSDLVVCSTGTPQVTVPIPIQLPSLQISVVYVCSGTQNVDVDILEEYKWPCIIINNRLNWKTSTEALRAEFFFLEEDEILQITQQNIGDCLSVSCGECSVLCCSLLVEQHQTPKDWINWWERPGLWVVVNCKVLCWRPDFWAFPDQVFWNKTNKTKKIKMEIN